MGKRDRYAAPGAAAQRWLATYSDPVEELGADELVLLPYEAWLTDLAATLAPLPGAQGAS